jgi:hypothetical protein
MFDGIEYSSVYATTNSVITFGRPDGTYWTYPNTPSISLYSFDWVVYPSWRSDEHLIIRSSDGGFQVDISARPIWLQNATEPTHIVITAAILSDGTVAMAYTLNGPEYPEYNPRTGVRLNNGEIVSFEIYGIQQTEQTPELAAEPTDEAPFNPPASETLTRTEDVTRTEDATRTEQVIREPEPVAPVTPIEPTPEPVTPEPTPEPSPEPTPEPGPSPQEPVMPVEPITPPEVITPSPGPVEPPTSPTEPEISPEAPVQEEMNIVEVLGAVVNAFATAGLDMTPEERKQAQSVVIPSVMVALVATSSMIRK